MTTLKLEDFKTVLAARPIALAILCHSLSAYDCEKALEIADSYVPGVKTIVLVAGVAKAMPKSLTPVVHAQDGPIKLIETVRHLLGSE